MPTLHMTTALSAASRAFDQHEVPVGAVIVNADNQVLAIAANAMRQHNDPTAHAEILAYRLALQKQPGRLDGCHLYVTLEPCAMCAHAAALLRLESISYAVADPKSGAVESGACVFAHSHHRPQIACGDGENQARSLLQSFFAQLRS